MKLIDKDALIVEIKKRQSEHDKKKYDYASSDHFWASVEDGKILSLIDTLEVKEVNLDEEIEKCMKRHNMLAVGRKDFTNITRYFFELGLKAQKGE